MNSIPLYEPSEIVQKQLDLPIDEIREWCEQASKTFINTDHSFHYFFDHQDDLYFHDEVSTAIDHATGYRPTHYWMQFYEWNDHMAVHSHRDDGNRVIRCGILYLDDIGSTTLICNMGTKSRKEYPGNYRDLELTIPSKAGLVITFPRDMLHYVTPHCVTDKMRYTLPFNCVEL